MSKYLPQKVAPPELPIPPQGAFSGYLRDLNNILRLFFNRIASIVNLISGEYGGAYISTPHAVFFSTVNQDIAAINTGQVVTFNNTYLDNGVTINGASNSQITVEYSGIYSFQFSAQPSSNSASSKVIYLWIARDGTDVGYTAKEFVLEGSTDVHDMVYTFNIDMQAGQYLEMKWSSDDIDTSLTTQTASSPHPGVPSAVMSVNFISTLPETLPTPP